MSVMSIKPAKVLSIDRIARDTYYLRVEPVFGVEKVEPFNFFMVWVPRIDEIPLSIAYADDVSYSFIFKIKGLGTQMLSMVLKGQFIGLKGPLGRGFVFDDLSRKILIISGGIGIAPIPFFIHKARYESLDIIWGVKEGEELFDLVSLFPSLSGRYRLIVATEDCSYGVCGTVLEALKSLNLNAYDSIIAVGPKQMLRKVCDLINGSSTESYIALETIVKCGIGLCGSCYIKSTNKLLCVDGPVFRCNEVVRYFRESLDNESL